MTSCHLLAYSGQPKQFIIKRTLSNACFFTLATDDDDMGRAESVVDAASGFIAGLATLCTSRTCSLTDRLLFIEMPGPQPEAAFFPAAAQLMMLMRGGDGAVWGLRWRDKGRGKRS